MDFFLVSHASTIRGPIDFFEEYLLGCGHHTVKLTHPLDRYDRRKTVVTVDGKEKRAYTRSRAGVINYVTDVLITLREIASTQARIFVGANNFDTCIGLLAKMLFFKSYRVVYFASDFSPRRYRNFLLDTVYLSIERLALAWSHTVISNTLRSARKRSELGMKLDKGIVVPNTSPVGKARFAKKRISSNAFIYVGNVTAEHGLLELLTVMRPAIRKLVVIGDGSQWQDLVRLTKALSIPTRLYRRKNHAFVVKALRAFGGFGLAPYNRKEGWTYYSSPLKIYEYLVMGVPVVTSDVTEIAGVVAKNKLGVVYHDIGDKGLIKKIQAFSTRDFQKKAKKFYSLYNANALYAPVLARIIQ